MKGTDMKTLYSTTVTAIGGRNGHVKSEDGILEMSLAMPTSLGGKGGASNPEQLFAAGYAACFENAVIHVTHGKAEAVRDDEIEVAATVGLVPTAQGGFALTVTMDVAITGTDQETAEAIVAAAHAVCPYSNAIKGNIEVETNVRVR